MIRLTRPDCPDQSSLDAGNYKSATNKAALRAACFDKCMYCESKIGQVYWGDVEHIRPKAIYPNLEFVWENLGYVCARCNNAKSDTWNDATPFIDPFSEDPSEHIAAIGNWIFHRNGSERGEYTWVVLQLNRPELVERRSERIRALANLIDKVIRTKDPNLRLQIMEQVRLELNDASEYAMASRAVLRELWPQNPD